MDIGDFEELVADMFGVSDEEVDANGDILEQKFQEEFDITMEEGFKLAARLIKHTPTVTAGLSGEQFNAFISKDKSIMLMKVKTKQQPESSVIPSHICGTCYHDKSTADTCSLPACPMKVKA